MIEPGSVIGKYRVQGRLGTGGMADVYLAEDTVMGRAVALKVLPPEFARDPERVARFEKEVRHLASLDHSHIVTIYDVGHESGYNYYAMALLPGGNLKDRIRKGLDPGTVLSILRAMAEALQYAHDRGLVHRDIKPENILFRKDGTPVLTDLGIARAIGAGTQMTRTGMSIGTPHYMSPEQARGRDVDGRSDIYSLGVVLFEMLTGEAPYHAEDTIAVALKHVSDPVPELPGERSRYQPLIDRMMAKDPDDRFAQASDLIQAIDALQAGQKLDRPSATRVMPRAETRRPEPVRKRSGLAWAAGGALLALVLVAGVYWYQSGSPVSVSPSPPVGTVLPPVVSAPVEPAVPPEPPPDEKQVVPPVAYLRVDANVTGARVLVDGVEVGLTPTDRLEVTPGDRHVEVTYDGYDDYQTRTAIDPGETASLSVVLRETPPLLGRLSVETDPDNARVRIMNIVPVFRQGMELSPGSYHIEVSAPGHETQNQWITLDAGEHRRLVVRLEPVDAAASRRVANNLGMEFVWIGSGEYWRGSPSHEPGRRDNERQHRVILTEGFYLQTTEVTVGQWRRFVRATGYRTDAERSDWSRVWTGSTWERREGVYWESPGFAQVDDNPVTCVTWNDVQQFIQWLNRTDSQFRYRLPTEAEWEYAARAGSTTRFHFGNDESRLGDYDWYRANSGGRTHPVATKRPNAWGLYDMHGNVQEWVSDLYGDYPLATVTNPTGPSFLGSARVVRGGSWLHAPVVCRSASRYWDAPKFLAPGNRDNTLGFRLAADPR